MVLFKSMPPVTYGLPTKSHISNLSTPSPSGSFKIQIILPTQHLPGLCRKPVQCRILQEGVRTEGQGEQGGGTFSQQGPAEASRTHFLGGAGVSGSQTLGTLFSSQT